MIFIKPIARSVVRNVKAIPLLLRFLIKKTYTSVGRTGFLTYTGRHFIALSKAGVLTSTFLYAVKHMSTTVAVAIAKDAATQTNNPRLAIFLYISVYLLIGFSLSISYVRDLSN